MNANLISIGQLDEKGCKIIFENKKCLIKLNETTEIEGVRCQHNNKLYKLKTISRENHEANVVQGTNDKIKNWKIWHNRLGHLGIKNMKLLKAEDIDLEGKNFISEFCESCALGKSTKLPHKSIKKEKIDTERITIHSDLMGPMRKKSIGAKFYVLTYICSPTEYSYTYFLKQKSEQFEKFREFKNTYELLRSKKINELRTDNGNEYLSTEFQNYLKHHGIIHNTSVAYSPQSNGKAERLNRTLVEKARCMIISSNVDLSLWSAAIDTANYLRNRSPSSLLNGMTPYEALYNKKPKIKHLIIFGSDAYPLELTNKRDKFEPTAKSNCIMIGYGNKEGIYWIFDKINRKAFRSRDVKFNEESILKNINAETLDLGDLIESFKGNVEEEEEAEAKKETKIEEEENKDKYVENLEVIFEEENNDDHTSKQQNNEQNAGNLDLDTFDTNFIETQEEVKSKNQKLPYEKQNSKRLRKQTQFYQSGESITSNKKKDENTGVYLSQYNEIEEPNNYKQAINGQASNSWKKAIEEELNSLRENDTWEVTNLPKNKNLIKTKWVFKIKRDNNNQPERFKARLVAKGYDQEIGIDYYETFAPVIKQQSLRLLLAIAINENLIIHHVDISTAFLNGLLDEDVYIEIPEGLKHNYLKNEVFKLKKALYGLKQASRTWNRTLVKYLQELQFKHLKMDTCIFYNNSIIIAVYVDDIVIFGKMLNLITLFKSQLFKKFKSRDLGELKYLLGITIERCEDFIMIHQKNYIEKLINQYKNLNASKPVDIPMQLYKLTIELTDETDELRQLIDPTIYRQAIGSLIYLMTSTRPDISFAVSLLSRFMQKPRELHWRFLKRLLRYIKTTNFCSLVFKKNNKMCMPKLIGLTDSDYAGSLDDRKSTSGYAFNYGECLISWHSSRQKTVSLSSTEAEYIGLTSAVKELIWLNQLLSELNRQVFQLVIYCDNKSAICLAKNPEFHARSKHIDIRHHFIREAKDAHKILIGQISTNEMPANIFTKALPKVKHKKCLQLLGIKTN